jgi:bacteriorhodopsin
MTCATFIFLGLGITKPRQHRVFHYITASITMVAAIAYFSMGSHLGWTPVDIEFVRNDPKVAGLTREIYYVRYIDWVITTPLLLLDLMLTAAMPWPTILFIILCDEVMIITGLVGALVRSSYKWGYFAFGCAALVYIVYVLVWEGRRHASSLGSDVGRTFLLCGSLTAFLWTLYPIAWGVCEGGNVISVDSEAIFYGILDVFAKPIFGALLIWGHRGIDPSRLGLYIHDYNEKDAHVVDKTGSAGPNVHPNNANNLTAANGTTAETV